MLKNKKLIFQISKKKIKNRILLKVVTIYMGAFHRNGKAKALLHFFSFKKLINNIISKSQWSGTRKKFDHDPPNELILYHNIQIFNFQGLRAAQVLNIGFLKNFLIFTMWKIL